MLALRFTLRRRQKRGDDPDPRDDVFALGVIWYQLLLRDLTRSAPTGLGWGKKLRTLGLGEGHIQLLGECFADDQEDRPRDAEELHRQLAALAADTPSVSRAKQAAIAPDVKTPAPVPPTAKPRKAGDVISPTLKMTFKYIEPGTFWMGSPDTDHEASADEKPQHQVTISKPFYLGTHQVTRGRFQQFVRNTGYKTDAEKSGGTYVWTGKEWYNDPKACWRNPVFEQTDEHPVVCVSGNDAEKFLDWLSEKEGRIYHLPTEAQWEYACRAGTRTRYFTGDDANSLAGYANVADLSYKKKFPDSNTVDFDDGYVYTSPVGVFKANPWGLHDMIGNVWEWCQDWYGNKEYQRGDCKDPKGPEIGSRRVSRGGCWDDGASCCRAARRVRDCESIRNLSFGFRLALVPSGG